MVIYVFNFSEKARLLEDALRSGIAEAKKFWPVTLS
jgi:hypothetical protein